LCPSPVKYLVQQEGYEEHALRLREMRDRNDRDAGLAALRPQELPDIERDPFEPRVEARGGKQVVHPHRELFAVLRRIERLDVQCSDLRHRRLLDLTDEHFQVQVFAGAPRAREEVREKDVLATLDRVGGDAKQTEDAARCRRDAVSKKLAVLPHALRWCCE